MKILLSIIPDKLGRPSHRETSCGIIAFGATSHLLERKEEGTEPIRDKSKRAAVSSHDMFSEGNNGLYTLV